DVVLGVVLVDAHERGGRVVLVVERTDAGGTVVVDLLARVERGDTLLVRGALSATIGSGDRGEVRLDGHRVGCAALDGGQRGQDHRVVGLRTVGEVVQRLALGRLVPATEPILEARLRVV